MACAGGADVLGAGETGFERAMGRSLAEHSDEIALAREVDLPAQLAAPDWVVREVSNLSTGYCPQLDDPPAEWNVAA